MSSKLIPAAFAAIALVAFSASSAEARGGVFFGFVFGVPAYAPPVYTGPTCRWPNGAVTAGYCPAPPPAYYGGRGDGVYYHAYPNAGYQAYPRY